MCRILIRICIILIPIRIRIWISINMEIRIWIPIAIKTMPICNSAYFTVRTKIKLFQIPYLIARLFLHRLPYLYWIGERDNLGGQQRVQVLSGQFLSTWTLHQHQGNINFFQLLYFIIILGHPVNHVVPENCPFLFTFFQCCGSGSVLSRTDPDLDPVIFVSDLQIANEFCLLLFEASFT